MTRTLANEPSKPTLELLTKLVAHPRFSAELARFMGLTDKDIDRAVDALEREFLPDSTGGSVAPLGQSVSDTLDRIEQMARNMDLDPPGVGPTMNRMKYWGDMLLRLQKEAQPWPKGKMQFRYVALYWDSLATTFEQLHLGLKGEFGEVRVDELLADVSKVKTVRDRHHPLGGSWMFMNLCDNRKRQSVLAQQSYKCVGFGDVMAFACQFPHVIRAIDLDLVPGFYMAAHTVPWKEPVELKPGERPLIDVGVPFLTYLPVEARSKPVLQLGVNTLLSKSPDFSVPTSSISLSCL